MIKVCLETGVKRVFASALDWPGWARAGRDATSALEALVEYAPRYATALNGKVPGFKPPRDAGGLTVVERLRGDATTDFGAPGAIAKADRAGADARALTRMETILEACWDSFDAAASLAKGAQLRTGPRGGGRDLEKMRQHVLEAECAYVRAVGGPAVSANEAARAIHDALLAAIRDRAHGRLPERGPRGGARWPARYAARRAAWHVLDHAWEISDRL